jgi:hypothetical protein
MSKELLSILLGWYLVHLFYNSKDKYVIYV